MARGATPVLVLLVGRDRLVREGVRVLLEQDPTIRVVGEIEGGRAAVQAALSLGPDVVLLDSGAPSAEELELSTWLTQVAGVRVLVLSAHEEPHSARTAPAAGAGVIVRRATSGAELREHVLGAGKRASRRPMDQLSPRELDVLRRVALGHTSREIASQLGLSVKTVETHRLRLMEKLDLHDIAGLTRYALRNRLIDG